MGPEPAFGQVGDWLPGVRRGRCAGSARLGRRRARLLREPGSNPTGSSDNGDPAGLFTGYYEPVLHGSRHEGGPYQVPLHAPPPRPAADRPRPVQSGPRRLRDLGPGRGRRVRALLHAAPRSTGARSPARHLELLWVDDPIAKFFLQIQGSGQVRLDDGAVVRVGYAGQNGRPYRAIGRDLIEIGALPRDGCRCRRSATWLRAHPADAATIMERNPSYIFFAEHPGARGRRRPARHRRRAADRRPLARGRPALPAARRAGLARHERALAGPPDDEAPLRRLMVAQDTGGAIKGVVRGDVFWGAGEPAEAIAGRMQGRGGLAVLLPKALVPTS